MFFKKKGEKEIKHFQNILRTTDFFFFIIQFSSVYSVSMEDFTGKKK